MSCILCYSNCLVVGSHSPSEILIRVVNAICKCQMRESKNSSQVGIKPLLTKESLYFDPLAPLPPRGEEIFWL